MIARKTHLNLIILFFSIILLQSCAKNEKEHFIEGQLETYFDEFSIEAQERGLEIDFDDLEISAYVENIEKSGTLGQCQQYSDGSKEVIIDEDYWRNLSSNEKEFLVFHELGHCVLGREHLDSSDERGNCISIMQSGEGACRAHFRDNNREEYLDELFGN